MPINKDCIACEGSGSIIGRKPGDPPQPCAICLPVEYDEYREQQQQPKGSGNE